jgi:membrane associated rhomboid family serine protease
MLPIRDINPVRTRPVVNYVLIAANVAMFVWMKTLPRWYEPGYSLVPTRIVADPLGEAFTVLSSMFMHANLTHIAGNLWFLWILGDNVEDALGRGRYLAFYLLGGVGAAAAQVVTDVSSPIPMVGASGAIAAVTAGYVMLYPRAPILVVNPFPPFWLIMGITLVVPAWAVAAEFFFLNAFAGLQSLGEKASGGVAVFAHLGGFFVGLFLIKPFTRGRERADHRAWNGWRPPQRADRRPGRFPAEPY